MQFNTTLGPRDSAPAPLGGTGDGSDPGGNTSNLDSGDDDDYWDGIQGDDDGPQLSRKQLMLQILETWWQSNCWLRV